jgi:hypothetical protein
MKNKNLPDWVRGKENPDTRKALNEFAQSRRYMGQGGQSISGWSTMPGGSLGDLANSDLEAIPASLPATRTYEFPLTDAEANLAFATEFAITEVNVQSAGVVGKFVAGASPAAPFFARGICIIARVDPNSYALSGGAVATPTVQGDSPLVEQPVPCPAGVPSATATRPAVFTNGQTAWQAYTNLLQSYSFQYILQGRYYLVNERAVDIGVLDSQWDMRGFGLGQYDPMIDINRANKHFADDLKSPFIFAPQNVASGGTAVAKAAGIAPALPDVQWGGPHVPGVFGCCMPLRPHVLFPGQSYQFVFSQNTDRIYHERLLENVTVRSYDKPSDLFNDYIPATGTTDPVWIGHVPFNYGLLQIGIMVRGAEILPSDTLEWLLMYGQPYMSLLAGNQQVFNSVTALASMCGLSGVPKPFTGPEDPRRIAFENRGGLGALGAVGDSDARAQTLNEIVGGQYLTAAEFGRWQ